MWQLLVPYRFAQPIQRFATLTKPDDAVVVGGGEPGEAVARIHEGVAARIAARDEPVFVLTADMLVGAAVVAGLQRRGVTPSVVWCSAYGALHTPHTTTAQSRGLDGVALAAILGLAGTGLTSRSGLRPLAPDHVAIVDGRECDEIDRAIITRKAIARVGFGDLARGELPPPPWSVHIDLDAIDPADVPPLRTPAPHGPRLTDVLAALRALRERGPIVALTIAASHTTRGLDASDALAVVEQLADATLGAHPSE